MLINRLIHYPLRTWQKRNNNNQVNIIKLNYGNLKLKSLDVNLLNDTKITSVLVEVDHKKINAKFQQNGKKLTVGFEGILLIANQELTIHLH